MAAPGKTGAALDSGRLRLAPVRRPITYVVDENGCHICTSHAPNTHGYPKLSVNNRSRNMHRVLYEEAFGEVPEGIVIRHRCDVRMCINLDHLVPGTPADNNADQAERGRFNPRRGERAGGAKLSQQLVQEIINAEGTQRSIAERYGVNQSQVSRIKSGARWAHMQEAVNEDSSG